jgi:hypothetical protein
MSKPKETVTPERLIEIGRKIRVAAHQVVHEWREYTSDTRTERYPSLQFAAFIDKLDSILKETQDEQWLPIASVPNEPKPTKPSRGSRSRPSSTGGGKEVAAAGESPLPASPMEGTSSSKSP